MGLYIYIYIYIQGSIAVTGDAIKWLRDKLGIITTAEESGK
jgi:glycerol kinase